jgi:predicted GNAT family acetyltransferase
MPASACTEGACQKLLRKRDLFLGALVQDQEGLGEAVFMAIGTGAGLFRCIRIRGQKMQDPSKPDPSGPPIGIPVPTPEPNAPPVKEPEPERLPDEIPNPNPDEKRAPPQALPVHDNMVAGRFELVVDDEVVVAYYRREQSTLIIDWVEAPRHLRGTGAADRLMRGILDRANVSGWRIIPVCGYAATWLRRNAA